VSARVALRAPEGVCLVGWAQVARHHGEPLDAWAAALLATGVPPARLDTLDVVYCQSWPYDDPPGRLAAAVGAAPRLARASGIGGTTPFQLLAAAADRIAAGEADVCAVVGGEALATVRRLRKAGERPAWSYRAPERRPFPFEAPFHPAEVAHAVFQAYTTFALRDVARRAHAGTAVEEHRASLGALFAPMSEVAAANPNAWFRRRWSAEDLVAVTPENRVVAHPYTKRLVAMMDVDLAGALVLASPAAADSLGIPDERRVWVRGAAAARDPDHVAEHPELWRSPAMAHALGGALAAAGAGVDDVDHLDLYSCFPSAVAFALDALGVDPGDGRGPFTVTGGLPYAGGPGSCYGLLSTAAMADVLVAEPGAAGLVTGVGMHLSKHAGVVLSSCPGPYAVAEPPDPAAVRRRPIVERHDGPGTVAAYTVHHGPDGDATDALLVCDVDGGRSYAVADDAALLAALEADEGVGWRVALKTDHDGVTRVSDIIGA
jgi:acetyl-CoA C-acetyltransferase